MRSPGSRAFTFLIGILIGMLAAIGLVFLMVNQFNPFAFFNNESGINQRDTIVDTRVSKKINSLSKVKSKENLKLEIVTTSPKIDSNASEFKNEIQVLNLDQEEIIIKRDEFLSYTEVEIIRINVGQEFQPRDSLINKLQGNPEIKKTIRIEFWKSPVNYQGYRLLANKIMLFGMVQETRLMVYKFKDVLYLRNGRLVYKIVENDDFESFEKVTDDSILKVLNP